MGTENMTYSAFESRYGNKLYIGSGGFSKVYKVFDHVKKYYIALKIADVRPEWKQFTLKREVELVNSLPKHKNIARYESCYRFNTGIAGDMDFAILKYYEYGNLEQFLSKTEVTDEDKRLIIQGILEGIEFLHDHDIIHRDMKSQNILLNREDGVYMPKITDFGLSRQIGGSYTMTNSAIGLTYAYAAPEQIKNEKINKNVDLWAVGVIIYRVIAGELPFRGRKGDDGRSTQSQLELSRKIINLELPDNLNTLPEPYQSIIRKCLVLDPDERVQSAGELIDILNEWDRSLSMASSSTQSEMDATDSKLADDPTHLVQQKEENSIKPASSTTEQNGNNDIGDLPNPNKTLYVPGQINEPLSVPPPFSSNVNTGEPDKRFNWLWVLVPGIVLIITASLFWLIGTAPDHSINEIEENTTGVIRLTPAFRTFEELNNENEEAMNNPQALKGVFMRIRDIVKEDSIKYRPFYIAGKNRVYVGEDKKAFQLFRHAAELAFRNGESQKLLDEILKDEMGTLNSFSRMYPIGWGDLKEMLLSEHTD